jgi:hypothetical protein
MFQFVFLVVHNGGEPIDHAESQLEIHPSGSGQIFRNSRKFAHDNDQFFLAA